MRQICKKKNIWRIVALMILWLQMSIFLNMSEDPSLTRESEMLAAKGKHHQDYDSVMLYNTNFQPHITKDVYIEGYVEENKDACDMEDTILLIMVISAPDHFSHREAIRKSWGEPSQYKHVATTFIVGLPEDPNTRRLLEQESEDHGDIIINKIIDNYQNLSLKILSAFQWLKTYCSRAEFLLKVDDDMFVQVNKILDKVRMILDRDPEHRLILGKINKNAKPIREPSKYQLTKSQYPQEKFPYYADGPSYLVSRRAATEILEAAMEHNYIHLEDVFLTGVVAESLHIYKINTRKFGNRIPREVQNWGCDLVRSFTLHMVSPEKQGDLHSLAQHPICGRGKYIKKT